jgi:hypothetical protein
MEENYILLMIQNFNGSLNENIKLNIVKQKENICDLVAEWLCNRLQPYLYQFKSGRGLQKTYPISLMDKTDGYEPSIIGSIPILGTKYFMTNTHFLRVAL